MDAIERSGPHIGTATARARSGCPTPPLRRSSSAPAGAGPHRQVLVVHGRVPDRDRDRRRLVRPAAVRLRAQGRRDPALVRIVEIRTVIDTMTIVALLTSRWVIRSLRWGTIAALLVAKRWRHLLVFVGALFVEGASSYLLAQFLGRPRPYDAWIVGPWQGYSMPSIPMSGLAVTLVGLSYSLIPHGKARDRAKWVIAAILVVASVARVYLGSDHATDAVFGAVLGVAVALTAFRWFAPNDIFPGDVRGREVGPPRRRRQARARRSRRRVKDQLGYLVVEVKPVGLEGSGGSTPAAPARHRRGNRRRALAVRQALRQDPRPGRPLVQARSHGAVRQARGREPVPDGARFVEYEDYTLRLMEDSGLPVPRPYGVARDHAGTRIHDRDGVLRRRGRDRRCGDRRRRDRSRTRADPGDVGRGTARTATSSPPTSWSATDSSS